MSSLGRGWGWPGLSKKPHYFDGGQSLCMRWAFTGDIKDGPATDRDCKECARRLARAAIKSAESRDGRGGA